MHRNTTECITSCPIKTYPNLETRRCDNCKNPICNECDGTVCKACEDNYYPAGNECKPCKDDNCIKCGSDGKCLGCAIDYTLNGGKCIKYHVGTLFAVLFSVVIGPLIILGGIKIYKWKKSWQRGNRA